MSSDGLTTSGSTRLHRLRRLDAVARLPRCFDQLVHADQVIEVRFEVIEKDRVHENTADLRKRRAVEARRGMRSAPASSSASVEAVREQRTPTAKTWVAPRRIAGLMGATRRKPAVAEPERLSRDVDLHRREHDRDRAGSEDDGGT
jgi:hypothetical protein